MPQTTDRCGQIGRVNDEQRRLTPERDKTIERIQLVCVLLLVGVLIAMKALADRDVFDTWKLLLAGFSVMVAMVALVGLMVGRVEERHYGEVMSGLLRGTGRDVKSIPARLRRRVADTITRLRPR